MLNSVLSDDVPRVESFGFEFYIYKMFEINIADLIANAAVYGRHFGLNYSDFLNMSFYEYQIYNETVQNMLNEEKKQREQDEKRQRAEQARWKPQQMPKYQPPKYK